jgi:hypothetical protein
MKASKQQLDRMTLEKLVRRVLKAMNDEKVLVPHATEEAIYKSALGRLEKELEKERQVDRDARTMVDDLDRKNPNSFDRHKMVQMIKRKLAEERKLVL